jgi:SSS family solute:Na+ symporter
MVRAGRVSTFLLMILAAVFALLLSDALQGFQIILQIGAGTGLIYLLRWFWWRINAISEITAMIVSFAVAVFLETIYPGLGWTPIAAEYRLLLGVGITTLSWIAATMLTKPTDMHTLAEFILNIRPHHTGWKPVLRSMAENGMEVPVPTGSLPNQLASMFFGCIVVYAALFATGYLLYDNMMPFAITAILAVVAAFLLARTWRASRKEPFL